MKIVQNPRTMNLSTFAHLCVRTCSFLLVMLFSTNAFGIDYVKIVRLQVPIGDTLYYDFYADCLTTPPEIEYHTSHPNFGIAIIDPDPIWTTTPDHYGECFDGTHTVKYFPEVSQIQRDTFYLLYDKRNENNLREEYFEVVIIDIVNRSITANNDYATTITDSSISIDVLDNDVSDLGGKYIDFVALQNNGSCTISNNELSFTPAPGFSGVATIEYTACDVSGSCDVGTVFVGVDNLESETLHYQLPKNKDIVIYDALKDYDEIIPPTSGTFVKDPSMEFHLYTPNLGEYNFTDSITLQQELPNGDIITKTLTIDVINNTKNLLTKEDNFWVCENDNIEFMPFSNDLLPYMSLNILGQPDHGQISTAGNGIFAYEVDFDTQARLRDDVTYRAAAFNWSWIEYQKINFHIDEFLPKEITYKLKTRKNVPLVLDYNTFLINPIEIYPEVEPSFPGAEDLEFVEGSFTWNGQTCTGGRMVVFKPVPDTTYEESFKLIYSPGNQNEYSIKVDVEIVDFDENSTNECIGNNCVWPGDMDNNGVVDTRDLLMLGYGIGSVGTPRTSATSEWMGQESESWDTPVFGTPIDYKYLDANGDGQVDFTDTTAIIQNFGLENDIYPSRTYGVGNVNVDAFYGEGTMLERAPLRFEYHQDNIPLPEVNIGDILFTDILLGEREKNAFDIHGLSFTLKYSTTLSDSNNVFIKFDTTSWFTQNSSVMTMSKSPVNGFLDAAITRTSGKSITGYGKIATMEYIIIIDVGGIKSDQSEIEFVMDDITIMNEDGTVSVYPPQVMSIPVYSGNTEHIEPKLIAFPNPSQGMFNLHLNGGLDKIIDSYEVYSMGGQVVAADKAVNSKSDVVDLSGQPSGVYFVKVITTTGKVLNQKIEIVE